MEASGVNSPSPSTNPKAPTQTSSHGPIEPIKESALPKKTEETPVEPWRQVKHKYKANGKEIEVDYDSLIKKAEKAHGADLRFQEASKKEKEAKEKFAKLQDPNEENWEELVDTLGFDKALKFAEALLYDDMQWKKLSPEQQDAILTKKENQKLKKQIEEREAAERAREKARFDAIAIDLIDKEVGEALDEAKAAGVPASQLPEVVELIVDEMLAFLEYADEQEKIGQPIARQAPSPKAVLSKIQKKYDERASELLKRMPVEDLKKILTAEQLSALRQANIEKLQSNFNFGAKGDGKKPKDIFDEKPSRSKANRRMKTDDFFSMMDKKFGR